MHTYFINKNGVQTYIDSRGIYLSYSIDSRNIVEVSLDSSIGALRLFQVASLHDITGFHIMAYNC